MAVLKMQRINLCALRRDRKKILELLQQTGVVEIERMPEEDDTFHRMDTAGQRAVFEKNAAAADNALEILQTYVPEQKSLLESLNGKTPLDYEGYVSVTQRQDKIMSAANAISNLARNITENKANIVKRETQYEALEPWKALDVPMNFAGTASTAAWVGTLSAPMTQEEICTKLGEAAPELEACDVRVISSDKDQTCICAMCCRKDAQTMEEALRTLGFARPTQTGSMIPRERQLRLEQKIEALKKDNEELEKKIAAYADSRRDLETVSDYYRTRAAKYEVLGGLLQSRKTFVLTGYVPARAAEGLRKTLDENFTLSVEIEDLTEEEEQPVLLQNNAYSSNYEGVVSSFGLPAKGEIDPTTIMSFFYIFLFGLMLSDAAYGMVIALACFVVTKKCPNMELGLRRTLRMFMWCGLSTVFWGIMFGSYFGDIVDVVARTYFGVTIPDGVSLVKALWFVPLNDPMKLLIWSMIFGLIHLFAGHAIKGYMLLRDKDYVGFVCDVLLWYVLLIGLILMLLPSSLFAAIAQVEIVLPAAVNTLAKAMAIIGAVGICLFSDRDHKNIGLRIALGAYNLYGVTGWLSDVLSYSRLLALGLATGVIASVVNQMCSMVAGGVIGTILFIIIFLAGHSMNLAINLLGAYVHCNRLQYVEFFGKFYEGGGRAFAPFTTNTKYVDIKEEMKL